MTTQQMVEVTKTVRGEVIAIERRALEVWHCSGCGLLYAVDAEWAAARRNDGKSFYCPNGCSRVFRETEADRLRKQIARREADLNGALDQLETMKRSRAALQGEVTKARKRAAAGVCLHCHRTFQNVARHMASKHASVGSLISGKE